MPSDAQLVPVNQSPWDRIKAFVLDSVPSAHSRRAYDKALTDFLLWYQAEAAGEAFTKATTVLRYVRHLEALGLSSSTVNVRLTAVRRLAAEAADNALMDSATAQGIIRVKGIKRNGTRTGNWLTRDQAEALINAPDVSTLKGKRDRALLAVLIGCGLRRSEVSELLVESIQQRDARWCVVDLAGKGNRVRTVPMPAWAKTAIDIWCEAAGITAGRVFRPMAKGGRITGDVLLPQNIMEAVAMYADKIGAGNIAPHDLRRTFAKLAHRGRAAIEQIQLSLGHSSIITTERYLGVRQDLQDAPCDHLGLRLCGPLL
jgi:site-specific recombinase XerD